MGFGPGGGPPGGPGGPGGFGIGNFQAKPLLAALDTDKDGKLSKEELIAGVKKFFADCDKEKKGSLTEAQLVEGFNRILPRPPGFPGGPGGFGGPPQAGQILPGGVKERLNLTDEQKKQLEQLQKEVDDKLAKILTDEQKKTLRQPFGPGGGPFGPPGGFGLGNVLASAVMKRADANKDGKVTLEELLTAAEALFKEADKGKKGTLDERALAAGINALFPPPGGFGPPGFGPQPEDAPKKPKEPAKDPSNPPR
jgi:hypothetical protein